MVHMVVIHWVLHKEGNEDNCKEEDKGEEWQQGVEILELLRFTAAFAFASALDFCTNISYCKPAIIKSHGLKMHPIVGELVSNDLLSIIWYFVCSEF